MSPETHLRARYFRPSWQGGDVEQPLCVRPRFGWAGPIAAQASMTDDEDQVSCLHCRVKLWRVGRAA